MVSVTSADLEYNTADRHGRERGLDDPTCSIATQSHPHTASADTRHTAAYRMARDLQMLLTDVQWVLGHAHLSTTEIYLAASREEVIESVLAHHARRAHQQVVPPTPAPGYDPASLDVLFGRRP
ncbi:hypothetical protein ACF08M_40940 [Streptomyces sp. NPDC015032]|uniref:hypothetical protein n=1 Tax=Streptomyces sp. NPDC015032 TaxID=3364937 RepID=UPI0036F7C99F